ncbi:hypothetical protein QTO34_011013 [Cnephaeus nilssonii]|uniref:PX domain-containing protein n=1 Tax=Cnephaeus nilssonii TaxID=3371016 RepID=A0AA40LEB3_CNENI|nr:hypothetical protein QTO34_011013 [Eptesicus nilssonii]
MDMNSLSPTMPTSPLSMINQVRFEDEPDLKDLFITVDDPESHVTTIETFITYRVATQTSRGEFDSSEFEVRRRYQDFLWLKGRLEEAHPTLIVPPLPEKFVVKGMVERFNDDFIETRRRALNKFLNRIADHPTLTFSEDFKVFLTAQAGELSAYRKQGPGLLSKVGQTVRAVALSMRGVRSRPEEFTEMNDFIEAFSQKMNLIDKISQRIYKEEREYFDEMKEYGPIHALWSESEEDLADTLGGVASCLDRCCQATARRLSGLSEALLPVVHEYVLYGEMLMGVMKRRDHIQAELESKAEALTYKKADTDLLTEEIGKLEDKVECANTALRADWERWKQNMRNDIKSAFADTAERNIHYYEQVTVAQDGASWKRASSPFCPLACAGRVVRKQVPRSRASRWLGAHDLPVNGVTPNPPTETRVWGTREEDVFSVFFFHTSPQGLTQLSAHHERTGHRFRERKGEERERNIDPQIWACALTENRTSNLLVLGIMSNHLSYTSQGVSYNYNWTRGLVHEICVLAGGGGCEGRVPQPGLCPLVVWNPSWGAGLNQQADIPHTVSDPSLRLLAAPYRSAHCSLALPWRRERLLPVPLRLPAVSPASG